MRRQGPESESGPDVKNEFYIPYKIVQAKKVQRHNTRQRENMQQQRDLDEIQLWHRAHGYPSLRSPEHRRENPCRQRETSCLRFQHGTLRIQ
jgi:hypothetical protein